MRRTQPFLVQRIRLLMPRRRRGTQEVPRRAFNNAWIQSWTNQHLLYLLQLHPDRRSPCTLWPTAEPVTRETIWICPSSLISQTTLAGSGQWSLLSGWRTLFRPYLIIRRFQTTEWSSVEAICLSASRLRFTMSRASVLWISWWGTSSTVAWTAPEGWTGTGRPCQISSCAGKSSCLRSDWLLRNHRRPMWRDV